MNADKQVCGRRLADEQADSSLRCPDAVRLHPRQLLWALAAASWPSTTSPDGSATRTVGIQHLASCGWRGLVRTRREGTQVFYRLEMTTSASSSPTPGAQPSNAAGGVPRTTSTR